MKDIGTISQTKMILDKYSLTAKKSFGQNFLIDNNLIKKIVNNADITKDTCVIEIGPGIGSLTQQLAINAKKVLCFEIDTRLKEVLEDTLSEYDNIDIIFDDFLKIDLAKIVEEHFKDEKDIVVVANLPYYITTPILIKIFTSNTKINRIIAMMQKEVGMRLSANHSTKDYNSLSVLCEYYSDAKIAFKVPKNVFIPAPNVDSVVLRFDLKTNREKVVDEQVFFKILRIIFKQRRKTLLNNLNVITNNKEETTKILNNTNLLPNLRAENLSLHDIIRLSDYIALNNYEVEDIQND